MEKLLAAEFTPAGIPSGGMLMLVRGKHVSLLKTLTGTCCLLMISICPGLTGKTINFIGKIEECIPEGVLPPYKNLPWLSKNLICAVRTRNQLHKLRLSKLAISLNVSLHTTGLYQIYVRKESILWQYESKHQKVWKTVKYLKWRSLLNTCSQSSWYNCANWHWKSWPSEFHFLLLL